MTALTHDRTTAIDREYHYRPIDANTPLGVKMLLISKAYGVAVISALGSSQTHFTHWAPLPTFKKDN